MNEIKKINELNKSKMVVDSKTSIFKSDKIIFKQN